MSVWGDGENLIIIEVVVLLQVGRWMVWVRFNNHDMI